MKPESDRAKKAQDTLDSVLGMIELGYSIKATAAVHEIGKQHVHRLLRRNGYQPRWVSPAQNDLLNTSP